MVMFSLLNITAYPLLYSDITSSIKNTNLPHGSTCGII